MSHTVYENLSIHRPLKKTADGWRQTLAHSPLDSDELQELLDHLATVDPAAAQALADATRRPGR